MRNDCSREKVAGHGWSDRRWWTDDVESLIKPRWQLVITVASSSEALEALRWAVPIRRRPCHGCLQRASNRGGPGPYCYHKSSFSLTPVAAGRNRSMEVESRRTEEATTEAAIETREEEERREEEEGEEEEEEEEEDNERERQTERRAHVVAWRPRPREPRPPDLSLFIFLSLSLSLFLSLCWPRP